MRLIIYSLICDVGEWCETADTLAMFTSDAQVKWKASGRAQGETISQRRPSDAKLTNMCFAIIIFMLGNLLTCCAPFELLYEDWKSNACVPVWFIVPYITFKRSTGWC